MSINEQLYIPHAPCESLRFMAHILAACKAICVALSSVSRTGGVQLDPTNHPSILSSLPPCLVTRHSLIIYSRMSTAWRWRERVLGGPDGRAVQPRQLLETLHTRRAGLSSCGCTPPTKGPCSYPVPQPPMTVTGGWFPKRFAPVLCLYHTARFCFYEPYPVRRREVIFN